MSSESTEVVKDLLCNLQVLSTLAIQHAIQNLKLEGADNRNLAIGVANTIINAANALKNHTLLLHKSQTHSNSPPTTPNNANKTEPLKLSRTPLSDIGQSPTSFKAYSPLKVFTEAIAQQAPCTETIANQAPCTNIKACKLNSEPSRLSHRNWDEWGSQDDDGSQTSVASEPQLAMENLMRAAQLNPVQVECDETPSPTLTAVDASTPASTVILGDTPRSVDDDIAQIAAVGLDQSSYVDRKVTKSAQHAIVSRKESSPNSTSPDDTVAEPREVLQLLTPRAHTFEAMRAVFASPHGRSLMIGASRVRPEIGADRVTRYTATLRAGGQEWTLSKRFSEWHSMYSEIYRHVPASRALRSFPPKRLHFTMNASDPGGKLDPDMVNARAAAIQRWLREVLPLLPNALWEPGTDHTAAADCFARHLCAD